MKGSKKYSKYDVSYHPEVEPYLKQIKGLKSRPLVGVNSLREIMKVLSVLPDIKFPVNSAGELISALGGSGKTLRIVDIDVDPVRMVKYMPSYYFPIANMENFVEKMAELIQENMRQVDLPSEMAQIRSQLIGVLSYPVKDQKNLSKMLKQGHRQYRFGGRVVNPEEMVKRIPENNFPIRSEEDLMAKIQALIVNRELIVPH